MARTQMRPILTRLLWLSSLILTTAAWGNSSQFPGPVGSDPWEHRPNDPDYADLWHLFSHLPIDYKGTLADDEKGLGSGMSVDKAWQLHTGSPNTLVAVLDSGVYWDSEDIRDRIFLNTGELPKPYGSAVYDKNGDGRVSVADYLDDPRVTDLNHNGVIDVGDVIMAFSDGIDNDGDGFVDNISGWDFHEHDNNPDDRINFGHGTGEAKDSVGAVNNGVGGAGGCPNCSVMFLRVNDSFVVDANSFAAAVHYAVDHGASVIQEALGSLNHNDATQEAVNYAWDHNVIIIGSAADENSYHHNYPGTLDPVIYVDAIRYDTQDKNDAHSFMAFNNCSNFGARVDVAASGISCSSEATGNLSGIAALASSYAKSLGITLTAGELSALIKTTATDINKGSNANDLTRHSTWKGWDKMTGYGRVNAFEILKAIRDKKIPPHVRIVSPSWFELYRSDDAAVTGVHVTGEVKTRQTNPVHMRLEVARGVDTAKSDWLTIKDDKNFPAQFKGDIANITLAQITALPLNTIDTPEYQNSVTMRLRVEDQNGLISESRRTIHVFAAPNLRKGFPVKMRGGGESSGLFVDLAKDGKQEFVTVDGAGYLHAFKGDGTEMAGFPVLATGVSYYQPRRNIDGNEALHASVFAPIASADLDGDGKPEIVVASLEGHIAVIGSDGHLFPGSPFQLPFPKMSDANDKNVIGPGIFSAPVLADLDQDGKKDIIVTSADGSIYAYDFNGHAKSGWPVKIMMGGTVQKIISSPAVYDLNGDGIPDVIFGTNHIGKQAGFLFAVDGRGHNAPQLMVAGFPVQVPLIRDQLLPTIGLGIPTAPAIADLDGDGVKEIVVHGFLGKPYILNLNGTIKRSLSLLRSTPDSNGDTGVITGFGHPGFANVLGDGRLSPVVFGVGGKMLVSMAAGGMRIPYNNFVGAWNPTTGAPIESRMRTLEDIPLMLSPVAADLDGDGKDEIIVGSGGYFVHAFSQNGEAQGFPAFTGGWVLGSMSVGDIDGDGFYDVACTTREGNVFVWKTKGSTKLRPATWPTFKGNNARTGVQGENYAK